MGKNLMVGTHKSSNAKWRKNYDETFTDKETKYNTCEDCGMLYEEKYCPRCYAFVKENE